MSKDTKLKIGDQNAETGELIYREMNDAEFAQYEVDKANAQKENDKDKAKAIAKAALLNKLGITAEEAVLLLS